MILEQKNLSSSETICEKLNPAFLSWFRGFVEGNEGCFMFAKGGCLQFKLTWSSSDAQLLYYIKYNLGFGQARIQDRFRKLHYYRVGGKHNLSKIICIFNGFLLKDDNKKEFEQWLLAYNEMYGTTYNFMQASPEVSYFLNFKSCWFSGFVDSIRGDSLNVVGGFKVSILDDEERKIKAKANKVRVYFSLCVKKDKYFLSKIAGFLGGQTKPVSLEIPEYYYVTLNLSNLGPLIEYFTEHKLISSKNVTRNVWLKIYYQVYGKEPFTDTDLLYIRTLITKYKLA